MSLEAAEAIDTVVAFRERGARSVVSADCTSAVSTDSASTAVRSFVVREREREEARRVAEVAVARGLLVLRLRDRSARVGLAVARELGRSASSLRPLRTTRDIPVRFWHFSYAR